MNTPYHIGLAFGLVGAVLLGSALESRAAAVIRDDYELTMDVARTAMEGWELLIAQAPPDVMRHGRYTDTDPTKAGKDFWSNGIWAKLDREGDGHHETLFVIRDDRLVYFGSLGAKGTFVDVAGEFAEYQGRSVLEFHQVMLKLQRISN